jgi:hypothetical protein
MFDHTLEEWWYPSKFAHLLSVSLARWTIIEVFFLT